MLLKNRAYSYCALRHEFLCYAAFVYHRMVLLNNGFLQLYGGTQAKNEGFNKKHVVDISVAMLE